MKTNFDINLPTIPGKAIKFKIQDIKNKAFGTQAARFKDNKGLLTKKFIQSFSNFHQNNDPNFEDDRQTQAESYFSQTRQPMTDCPMQFHLFIPEQKKHLINLQQKLKREKQSQLQDAPSYLSQKAQSLLKSRVKGYSFNKAQKQFAKQEDYQNEHQNQLTDNYYFTRDEKQVEDSKVSQQVKKIKLRENAVFKAQKRTVVYERLQKSIVPGPGAYTSNLNIKNKQTKLIKKPMSLSNRKQQRVEGKKEVNYQKLKDIISKVMNEGRVADEEEQKKSEQEKGLRNQHMFMADDRDRFGNQLYPIAPKLKTPGPGYYNSMPQTIESKAKKVQVVEQQRKLLKQWFNN